jgi:hypothetical protein
VTASAVLRLLASLLLTALILAGCTETLQTATGIVTSVTSTAPGSVDGFDLRTDDGAVITFSTRTTQFDRTGFPPQHLREHQALATPIRVTYRSSSGTNEVVKLEDAPG